MIKGFWNSFNWEDITDTLSFQLIRGMVIGGICGYIAITYGWTGLVKTFLITLGAIIFIIISEDYPLIGDFIFLIISFLLAASFFLLI